MLLINTIKADQLTARKDRNTELSTLLTTLYSEAAMVGKNDGERDTTDDEVIKVVKKFIKNAHEVIKNLSTEDKRCKSAIYENHILSQYLPLQLSFQELHVAVETIIRTNDLHTMKDMGTIMKHLNSSFDGLYDGKTASQIIKELLK